jgi:hypothetical protein
MNGATLALRDPATNTPGVITNRGTARFEGGNTTVLSCLFLNEGALEFTGSVQFSNGVLRNLAGRTMRFFSGNITAAANTTNLLENYGTLRKVGANVYSINAPMLQRDAMVVQEPNSGDLRLAGAGVHERVAWNIDTNSNLDLEGGQTFIDIQWQLAPGARVRMTRTAVTHLLAGRHTGVVQGEFSLNGSTLVATGATPVELNFTDNGFQWLSGTLDGGTVGFRNAGRMRLESSSLTLRGTLTNAGVMELNAGISFGNATLRNAAGATMLVRSANFRKETSASNSLFENYGVLRTVASNTSSINIPVQNAGLIDLRDGSIWMNEFTQTDGETRVRRNRELRASPFMLSGGALTGVGLVNLPSGTLTITADPQNPNNPGTLAPGIDDPDEPTLSSLGVLTLNGNLTIGADGVFEVDIAGTNNTDPENPQYDQLRFTRTGGSIQLNGVLRLKGRNGYVPRVGDQFDIIVRNPSSSWNRTGAFRAIEVDADTLPCVQFEVQYLTDRVRVRIVRFGNTDVNGDGCIDDADLLAVLFNFGATGNNLADANCDGVVDDADLLAVLFNFGSGC